MTSLDDELRLLAARRWRVAITLTAAVLISYFGFILLVAFDKPLMGTLVWDGTISVGILLGAAVIVISAALTGVYVRWANHNFDAAAADLKARHARAADAELAARAAVPGGLAVGSAASLPALPQRASTQPEVRS